MTFRRERKRGKGSVGTFPTSVSRSEVKSHRARTMFGVRKYNFYSNPFANSIMYHHPYSYVLQKGRVNFTALLQRGKVVSQCDFMSLSQLFYHTFHNRISYYVLLRQQDFYFFSPPPCNTGDQNTRKYTFFKEALVSLKRFLDFAHFLGQKSFLEVSYLIIIRNSGLKWIKLSQDRSKRHKIPPKKEKSFSNVLMRPKKCLIFWPRKV